jgi:hypothetical protein
MQIAFWFIMMAAPCNDARAKSRQKKSAAHGTALSNFGSLFSLAFFDAVSVVAGFAACADVGHRGTSGCVRFKFVEDGDKIVPLFPNLWACF